MVRTPRRRGRTASAAVCLALAVAGCSGPDIRSGGPPVKLCGVTFWSGADHIGTTPLTASSRGMPAAPAASRLPASAPYDGGPPPRIVSVSSDCSHGRTVVVSPAASVRLRTVAKDGAGRVLALSLVPARPGRSVEVHVYAYAGTRPAGQVLTVVP
ncbi:hypothetical protein [Streptomyces griseorubiginosus]|uniref:hypothetical protein n=1 Tax=Streptomyces griseorubiginosus TaxID=67304 RepID=UPI001AD7572B|nr:hypothetical protein [Streptomyces griseorubiginosus]MBO4252715.1 hypothetical protein [Streptomyces griseorubiginosus]